jgi:hypothetical protein
MSSRTFLNAGPGEPLNLDDPNQHAHGGFVGVFGTPIPVAL